MLQIHCTNCHQEYPETGAPYRCPKCGGLFDFYEPILYDPASIEIQQPGIWRYRHALGLPVGYESVSLGEGGTPLVWSQAFGTRVGFKCEYINPTGSFKDRGSAPILSFVRGRGVQTALEDSSGNAGASFAAYAARAGVQARVFIPDATSGPKRAQIQAYGAEIVRIMGPRSNAAEVVRRAAEAGEVYASHAYLPFNLPGYATLAYELYEQLGSAPGSLIVPVGQGGLILGIARGFQALQHANLIESAPALIGVQARACAPLWALASYGSAGLAWVAEARTLAEGLRVSHPLRGDAVMQSVTASQGMFVAVDEEDIMTGRAELARRGLYVEPTSAVVWSGLAQVVGKVPEPIVVVLTGSGLKSEP
ncbi:MAG TPA: pyridoxal-phosphate dependent enzyme [Anaerolineales bacterium]|nr:pyridoxal-phosphate dependent enzyme [Anaerolineales bacterium]